MGKRYLRPDTTSFDDDKRLVPRFTEGTWSIVKSVHRWHYCKYCHRKTPSFILVEGFRGNVKAHKEARVVEVLGCCWECGSGIALLSKSVGERIAFPVDCDED